TGAGFRRIAVAPDGDALYPLEYIDSHGVARMRPPRSIVTLLLALVLGLAAPIPASAQREPVLVFAAASMKNALDAAVAAWGKRGEGTVRVSYAASSALARQIEQGA